VARYGGEEFACILPGTKLETAMNIAERIRKSILALEISHVTSSVSPFVTVSLGVATVVDIDYNRFPKNLITEADRMLYLAKEQGRNQVRGRKLYEISCT